MRETCLILILEIFEAFSKSSDPAYKPLGVSIRDFHHSLQRKVIQFPARDMTAMSPVFTPFGFSKINSVHGLDVCGPVFIKKTQSDLNVTLNYVYLIREMLKEAILSQSQSKARERTTLVVDQTLRGMLDNLHDISDRIAVLVLEVVESVYRLFS